MKKSLLLLGAALMAAGASAQNFAKGEAFTYDFTPGVFEWYLTGADGELYVQYPYEGLKGQASLAEGFGAASVWFNGKKFDTPEAALTTCPAVEYPAASGQSALQMLSDAWWGFGNFNFALPEVGQPCRVRVVFKTDVTGECEWNNPEKPFHIKLMDDGDQDTADYPEVNIQNIEFWNNQGWYVVTFESELEKEGYYLSLLWDAGGLSCGRNIPMYVREVSVVPTAKIPGYASPADGKSLEVLAEAPELVTVGAGAGVENIAAEANAPAEYFNLQGIRVAEPANGVFIRRQGNKVTKVAL